MHWPLIIVNAWWWCVWLILIKDSLIHIGNNNIGCVWLEGSGENTWIHFHDWSTHVKFKSLWPPTSVPTFAEPKTHSQNLEVTTCRGAQIWGCHFNRLKHPQSKLRHWSMVRWCRANADQIHRILVILEEEKAADKLQCNLWLASGCTKFF